MACPAPARTPHLQPHDWVQAGFIRLSRDGIDAVRVEVLARDLGVSKGSFYWHFRDREDLLGRMLERWEEEEGGRKCGEADSGSAATRWAQFIERTADPARIRTEAGLRAWARRDERVASRVAAIERMKAARIAEVLREVGFQEGAAESWAEIVLLVCLGWLDRATRDREFQISRRGLGEFLSETVLAASARTSAGNR
jgi:AcrR family transcriptional regulator